MSMRESARSVTRAVGRASLAWMFVSADFVVFRDPTRATGPAARCWQRHTACPRCRYPPTVTSYGSMLRSR